MICSAVRRAELRASRRKVAGEDTCATRRRSSLRKLFPKTRAQLGLIRSSRRQQLVRNFMNYMPAETGVACGNSCATCLVLRTIVR